MTLGNTRCIEKQLSCDFLDLILKPEFERTPYIKFDIYDCRQEPDTPEAELKSVDSGNLMRASDIIRF